MDNLAPTTCVVVEKLQAIETRLRTKAYGAAKNNWICAAYGQAANEVQHERFEHVDKCNVCRREFEAWKHAQQSPCRLPVCANRAGSYPAINAEPTTATTATLPDHRQSAASRRVHRCRSIPRPTAVSTEGGTTPPTMNPCTLIAIIRVCIPDGVPIREGLLRGFLPEIDATIAEVNQAAQRQYEAESETA